jgi:hypothetical protein
MKKCLLLIVLPCYFLASCKNKIVSLADNDDKLDAHDFIEFFQPLKLPFLVADTILRRKEAPASFINAKLFARMVPDTVLGKLFGKELKPKLYTIGRINVPDQETYLLVKAVTSARRVLYILCFDNKNKFAAARPMIYNDNQPGVTGEAGMDAKYTLSITHQRRNAEGNVIYKKDDYVYTGGAFVLILTESNEASTKPPVIYDPIDTFPHHHKFTGDYSQDPRNFVAIRDGKDAARILFFIHFEKDDASCKGELKGDAKFISPSTARYKANSDPCTVDFSFDPTGVTVKEVEGCGSHRDIKCFFEGYYERHKEAKPRNSHKKNA